MTIAPNPRPLALLAALTAAFTGLWALAAWGLNEWHLVSLGEDFVPMAPLTALMFVVLGLVLAAQERWPESRAPRRACQAGALLVLGVSGVALLQSWSGFVLPWTDWLVRAPESIGKIPVGRMSPVTALCFLLTAGVLLMECSRWADRAAVRRAALVANGVVLATAGMVALSYATGTPLFYGAGIVPMALLTALAFLALTGSLLLSGLLDRLMAKVRMHDRAGHLPADHHHFTRRMILAGSLIGGLIILAGIIYVRREQAELRLTVYQQLEAIAALKAREITNWRRERLGEAQFLHRTPAVIADLTAFAAQPGNPEIRARVVDWLEPIKSGDRYASLTVLDAQTQPLLTLPASVPANLVSPDQLAEVLARRTPVISDLHSEAIGLAPHLSILVPIFPHTGAVGRDSRPVAFVVMSLDPRHFLFPIIQDWPLPSDTAETLLVRREGDEMVYLNEVRHRTDAPLTLRRSVQEMALPAALAGRGETGVHEGVDYRGTPVLAAIRPIPGSPWILIAKVDQAEAYAAIQRDTWQTGIAVLLLLLAVVLAGTSLWRWRHAEFLRRALASERERQALTERLALVTQFASDIILLLDENGRILEANECAVATYGYTLEELRNLPNGTLRPPGAAVDLPAQIKKLYTPEGTVFETVHRRKDGSEFPVEVSGRRVSIGGRPHLLGVFRDITERKQAAAALHLAHERTSRLVNANVIGVVVGTKDGVVLEANDYFLRLIGYSREEFAQGKINWVELTPAEWRAPEFRAIQQLMETGSYPPLEKEYFRRDGTRVPVVLFGTLLPGPEMHLAAFILDLTEPRQAAAALRASEVRYRRLFESAKDGILILDADSGIVVDVNPFLSNLLGYSREAILGKKVWELGFIRDFITNQANFAELQRENYIRFEDKPLKSADGRRIDVEFVSNVYQVEGRKVIQCNIRDISERRQAEASLRDSEHRYRLITESTTDLIWLYDLAIDAYVYVSPSVERMLGYTRAEHMAKGLTDTLTPESAAAAGRILQARLAALARGEETERTYTGEFEVVHKSGAILNCEFSVNLLLDEAGQPTRILGVTRDITDRRRAEAALRESESMLREAQIIAGLGSYDLDVVTGRWSTSAVLDQVFGIGPDYDHSVAGWLALIHPEEQTALAAYFRDEVIGRHQPFDREYRIIRQTDRAERWAWGIGRLDFDATGRPVRMRGTIQDITGRKLAELELQKLSRVVEQSPTSVIITNLTGAIEYVNPWFCRLTGYTPADVIGRNPRMLKSGDTPAETYTDMWRTLAACQTWRGELVNRKKNGELYTELAVIAPVFGLDGSPSHYVAIKDDITERKQLENFTRQTLENFNAELEIQVAQRTGELAVQARQLQALLDSIPDTVMRLRTDGTVLHSQPADLGGDALAASLELGHRALATGTTIVGETEFATPGGTLALELRTAPIGTDEFVVFARDITARKRLEVETAAMLEKERQVSEMKTRFISVISHEFRTPMTAIAGSVELLANHLDRLSAEKRAEILERINRSQLRMTAMLDDVLMLNRMEANRTEVRLATVSLESFVQNIVSEVRAADHDAHPFVLPPDWPVRSFVTDPNLLHHILANLLGNAVRYSPAGAVVTLNATSDAWRLTLAVEDRGIGIPPGDRVRIFEPFERGSNVGHIKGTGLGLNIVKRLTDLLGGAISLRPLPDGGTRFTLTFPLQPPPATAAHESPATTQDPRH